MRGNLRGHIMEQVICQEDTMQNIEFNISGTTNGILH